MTLSAQTPSGVHLSDQELNAVKDFNHTRFLGLQDAQGQESEQEENLKMWSKK